jgi:hypothetical protein
LFYYLILGMDETEFRATAAADGSILSHTHTHAHTHAPLVVREWTILYDNRQGKREVLREEPLPIPFCPP